MLYAVASLAIMAMRSWFPRLTDNCSEEGKQRHLGFGQKNEDKDDKKDDIDNACVN